MVNCVRLSAVATFSAAVFSLPVRAGLRPARSGWALLPSPMATAHSPVGSAGSAGTFVGDI